MTAIANRQEIVLAAPTMGPVRGSPRSTAFPSRALPAEAERRG